MPRTKTDSPNDRMPGSELRALRAMLSPPGELMSWEAFGETYFGVCGRTMRRYARDENKRGVPYTVAREARRLKIEALTK